MEKFPFYTALTLVQDLFGLELSEDQFETWGIIAYNKIGNKESILKRGVFPVIHARGQWYAMKPCDMSAIEMITIAGEDF